MPLVKPSAVKTANQPDLSAKKKPRSHKLAWSLNLIVVVVIGGLLIWFMYPPQVATRAAVVFDQQMNQSKPIVYQLETAMPAAKGLLLANPTGSFTNSSTNFNAKLNLADAGVKGELPVRVKWLDGKIYLKLEVNPGLVSEVAKQLDTPDAVAALNQVTKQLETSWLVASKQDLINLPAIGACQLNVNQLKQLKPSWNGVAWQDGLAYRYEQILSKEDQSRFLGEACSQPGPLNLQLVVGVANKHLKQATLKVQSSPDTFIGAKFTYGTKQLKEQPPEPTIPLADFKQQLTVALGKPLAEVIQP